MNDKLSFIAEIGYGFVKITTMCMVVILAISYANTEIFNGNVPLIWQQVSCIMCLYVLIDCVKLFSVSDNTSQSVNKFVTKGVENE